jgi:hypothetical protein
MMPHKEGFCNLYRSLNIFRTLRSATLQRARHIARLQNLESNPVGSGYLKDQKVDGGLT